MVSMALHRNRKPPAYSHACHGWSRIMIVPKHLLEDIGHLQERFESVSAIDTRKIAVFDLDNTLIEGDIGDAVYASLLRDGAGLTLPWESTGIWRKKIRKRRMKKAAKALEGLSIQHIIALTRKIMQSEIQSSWFQAAACRFRWPNPAMKELIRILPCQWDFIIVDISEQRYVGKSRRIGMVQYTGRQCFRHSLCGLSEKITRTLLTPLPVGEGKVSLFGRM